MGVVIASGSDWSPSETITVPPGECTSMQSGRNSGLIASVGVIKLVESSVLASEKDLHQHLQRGRISKS